MRIYTLLYPLANFNFSNPTQGDLPHPRGAIGLHLVLHCIHFSKFTLVSIFMTIKERNIKYAFKGKLVGSKFMIQHVCAVLALMEDKIIHEITTHCWFVSSTDDAWAFVLQGNELKDKHLIFVSEDLLRQSRSQIQYTIAHEIGHVVLGHRNSILVSQTKAEIRKQEKEADVFAKKYLTLSQ